jgi:purine-binding chemotaxis protein CheW
MQTSSSTPVLAEVLTFDLGGETFALGAGLVREVMDVIPETEVPGAPAFVRAVVNFRGRIIPLADLRHPFGLDARALTRDSRIIVIEFELDGSSELIGLRADKVHEVTTIDGSQREPPPRIGLRWPADFIEALVRRGDDLIVLPDLARVFAVRGQAGAPVVAFPSSTH